MLDTSKFGELYIREEYNDFSSETYVHVKYSKLWEIEGISHYLYGSSKDKAIDEAISDLGGRIEEIRELLR